MHLIDDIEVGKYYRPNISIFQHADLFFIKQVPIFQYMSLFLNTARQAKLISLANMLKP